MIFVTGGAGFIGSNFIRLWLAKEKGSVLNIDKLTYSGNLENLKTIEADERYKFAQIDICDFEKLKDLFIKLKPCAIIHFAAESHVDRSIHGPLEFVKTNVLGTFNLLQAAKEYWIKLEGASKENFRFIHVSTDEVYGSLGPNDPAFDEEKKYEPNSPYSATKAASDHLVRSYFHTYGLPVITTNCSNNYGPYQFPEKLIPLMIHNALLDKKLPVYGDGLNVRDWLYVEDHCEAIIAVLKNGKLGEVYNIGGNNEVKNIDVVKLLCQLLDEMHPRAKGKYEELIEFVKDRAGHDRRYAIDSRKIMNELKWMPLENFESGFRKTVEWYLKNQDWVKNITTGEYQKWIAKNY
jgi:dTDP-glucose 4,6-dehydratase